MNAIRIATIAVLLASLGTLGVLRAIGQEASGGEGVPPAATDTDVPSAPMDMGVGERLLLVVGDTFRTRLEAERAAADVQSRVGHLQGFYAAPVSQFEGLASHLGAGPGDFALLSAFRTEEGAAAFAEFLSAMGVASSITPRMENRGTVFVGLGQEAHPDGSGPLLQPLPGAST